MKIDPTSDTVRPGALCWVNLTLATLLVAGLTVYLWPQWQHNPDLSHGWFTPLVFVFLIHEARTRGTPRYLPAGKLMLRTTAVCVCAGLLLLIAGGLYMAALEWTHALVAVMLTSAVCALLAATWITAASDDLRLLPFNWTAGVAILLWLLSTPLPPGTYATLTQALQTDVTRAVLGLLHLLSIAAVRHGNIIQLTTGTVGVEEACSGVRSLLSCFYTGLFFSAVLVRRPWPRTMIILLAGPLAFAMNLLRSLTLTLLSHRGVDIRGTWHDSTGYAIVGVTAVILAALALWLNRHRPQAVVLDNPRQRSASPSFAPGPSATCAARARRFLALGLVLAVTIAGLLFFNTRPASNPNRSAPDLAALLPTKFSGWLAVPDTELYRFAPQLQTSHLVQTTYQRQTAQGLQTISVYLAYWPIGQVPVSLVATHTPDACWPGSGWTAIPRDPSRVSLLIGDRMLADAEYRIFTQQGFTQHVWFWHVFDGRVIHLEGVRSPRNLLLLALRYGFHRNGEQLFVRVSSDRPWEEIASEPLLQEIFARLTPFGL